MTNLFFREPLAEETLDLLGSAAPAGEPSLVPELAEAIAPFPLLEDASLWRAARSHLAADAAERLENLHLKRQRDGLASDEDQACSVLAQQYERALLVRAEAAAELRRRGHDVSALVAP